MTACGCVDDYARRYIVSNVVADPVHEAVDGLVEKSLTTKVVEMMSSNDHMVKLTPLASYHRHRQDSYPIGKRRRTLGLCTSPLMGS